MGLDTISDRVDGTIITQSWFNVLQSVLTGDLVPRDSSGAPSDQAGSLGQITLAWLFFYFISLKLYYGSYAVTLQAAAGMVVDYVLTLPQVFPGSGNRLFKVDPQGICSFADVDNSTLEIISNTLRIKDAGVTRANLAAASVVVSSSCGTANITNNPTPADVSNLTATIPTTGRSVLLALVPDAVNDSFVHLQSGGAPYLNWNRDGTIIGHSALNSIGNYPCNLSYIDPSPSIGTHTYKIQFSDPTGTGSTTTVFHGFKLLVMEI
jgi:hypothetical protein